MTIFRTSIFVRLWIFVLVFIQFGTLAATFLVFIYFSFFWNSDGIHRICSVTYTSDIKYNDFLRISCCIARKCYKRGLMVNYLEITGLSSVKQRVLQWLGDHYRSFQLLKNSPKPKYIDIVWIWLNVSWTLCIIRELHHPSFSSTNSLFDISAGVRITLTGQGGLHMYRCCTEGVPARMALQ